MKGFEKIRKHLKRFEKMVQGPVLAGLSFALLKERLTPDPFGAKYPAVAAATVSEHHAETFGKSHPWLTKVVTSGRN